MNRLWIPLLVAACTTRVPAPSPTPSAALIEVRTTDGAVALGDLEASIASARKRLERDSEDLSALVKLARGLLQRGTIRHSQGDLERALALANVSAARQRAPPSACSGRAAASRCISSRRRRRTSSWRRCSTPRTRSSPSCARRCIERTTVKPRRWERCSR